VGMLAEGHMLAQSGGAWEMALARNQVIMASGGGRARRHRDAVPSRRASAVAARFVASGPRKVRR